MQQQINGVKIKMLSLMCIISAGILAVIGAIAVIFVVVVYVQTEINNEEYLPRWMQQILWRIGLDECRYVMPRDITDSRYCPECGSLMYLVSFNGKFDTESGKAKESTVSLCCPKVSSHPRVHGLPYDRVNGRILESEDVN